MPVIRSPFTEVPFVEPRSRTVRPVPAEKAACLRETSASSSTTTGAARRVAADDDLDGDGHLVPES